jgi:A/G-specific adenine glycosylase
MTEMGFTPDAQQRLLDWYRERHRQLPWRDTRDPYRILVSEVMLQQTQVERVVPKYHAFLEQFPTLQDLATAPTSAVIRAWSGLGYNRRALNLQRACLAVVERYGGVMPSDPAQLATLPGIGPYTAGAVACFAFEKDVAFVDTNIRRVIHRVQAGPEVPQARMTARQVDEAARRALPAGNGYTWNQALMELGATICRARSTACEDCPLQTTCQARPTIQALLAQRTREPARPAERFETTSRFYRGRIVDALRAASSAGLTAGEIGQLLRPEFSAEDAAWVTAHLAGLERDGLIVRVATPSDFSVQEESPAYEAGPSSLNQRYALPD